MTPEPPHVVEVIPSTPQPKVQFVAELVPRIAGPFNSLVMPTTKELAPAG
jgi:hypothetical protein